MVQKITDDVYLEAIKEECCIPAAWTQSIQKNI